MNNKSKWQQEEMEMEENKIKDIVKETILELEKKGYLKNKMEYEDVLKIIRCYYENGENDEKMKKCIKNISNDRYFNIIPLYFKENKTIECIAEEFKVDRTTISRNKKDYVRQYIYNTNKSCQKTAFLLGCVPIMHRGNKQTNKVKSK